MRTSRATQPLSYHLRLPDQAQADALRLLDVSREVINTALVALWPQLDKFSERDDSHAYQQVEAMIASPQPHGNRQWRCEAEMVGRILRGQAERKKRFVLIMPILSQGMIRPKTEKNRAGKNRKAITAALADLRQGQEDDGNVVELQSLIEQCCNFYLANGHFPETYEEMQAIPVLKVGQLPYAGDDGPAMGQSYHMSIDLDAKEIHLSIRFPDEQGKWSRAWRERSFTLRLPELVAERIKAGGVLAPTLRAVVKPDGSRYALLDLTVNAPTRQTCEWEDVQYVLGFDWGIKTLVTASVVDLDGHQVGRPFFLDTGCFDGHQARTRRQIDLLKARVSQAEQRRDQLTPDNPQRARYEEKLKGYEREIARCWRKYNARNRDLAHLAANVLLLLATAQGCSLIAGESLKSLKSTGRGRDAKGRWRNWRNNSQIRGELWRVLRYKCQMVGLRLEWQQPRKTSHTCPRCGEQASTYRSPEHLSKEEDWGSWLWCERCGWNGSRDYAASLNIARLGANFLMRYLATGKFYHASITDSAVKPVSYIGIGAVLRLPPPVPRDRLFLGGRVYMNGWRNSVKLRSSYATDIMLRFSG